MTAESGGGEAKTEESRATETKALEDALLLVLKMEKGVIWPGI